MSCSRTQHGGGRSRTPDLSLRSPTLYHWATALPLPNLWQTAFSSFAQSQWQHQASQFIPQAHTQEGMWLMQLGRLFQNHAIFLQKLNSHFLEIHGSCEPEDHWSCIAHLIAEDMLKSAVIEEKTFKHSPWAGADNPLGPKFWCQQVGLITMVICCKFTKNSFNLWLYTHLFMI